jgi:predicted membrane channel-forming protein YqfA (hemolysin III family)
MNKIIVHIGLLLFFISIIIFSQQGMLVEDVLLKSFIIFFVATLMLTILALSFIRAINKTSVEKHKNFYS